LIPKFAISTNLLLHLLQVRIDLGTLDRTHYLDELLKVALHAAADADGTARRRSPSPHDAVTAHLLA
jgi:hypothetical protein